MRDFFINSLTLGTGVIALSHDQIVCIVGPNSSGKSSFLKTLKSLVIGRGNERPSILSSLEIEKTMEKDSALILAESVAKFGENSISYRGHSYGTGRQKSADFFWNYFCGNQGADILSMFVDLIDTRDRLTGVGPIAQVNLLDGAPPHALHSLYLSPYLEEKLCDISAKIFKKEVMLNPGAGSNLVLHVGKKLDPVLYGGNRSQDYANAISSFPSILEEGDGVQAAVGLIARLLTSNCPCILVDEPDLYLHPPQAYELGEIFGKELTDKQVFFSTHSAKFLQGIFRSAPNRLKVIRLEQDAQGNFGYQEVDTSIFNEVKSDPILKFTNILEAVFYENLVICEDASDCLLFKTVMDRLGLLRNEQNSFWIGAFGKGNFAKILRISRALGIKSVCVADFDLISSVNDSVGKVLRPILEALGLDPSSFLETAQSLDKSVASVGKTSWGRLKENGLDELNFDNQLHMRFEAFLYALEQVGVYVIRKGETESLCAPRLAGHGAVAVSSMLELDVLNDHRLERAREAARGVSALLA